RHESQCAQQCAQRQESRSVKRRHGGGRENERGCRKYPRCAGKTVVFRPPDDGGIAVGRKRDGLTLGGISHCASADQLCSLLDKLGTCIRGNQQRIQKEYPNGNIRREFSIAYGLPHDLAQSSNENWMESNIVADHLARRWYAGHPDQRA